jgi:hypothetical protein
LGVHRICGKAGGGGVEHREQESGEVIGAYKEDGMMAEHRRRGTGLWSRKKGHRCSNNKHSGGRQDGRKEDVQMKF